MRVNSNGRAVIQPGETMPAKCLCGKLYQPPAGSECSNCPHCKRLNVHAHLPGWKLVKA
jgi:hypothetical protein